MSPFRILLLPHLALKDVIDCWNILESYQFSKVSKKCKEIAKYRFRTPPDSVYFTYTGYYYVRLKYRGTKLHGDYYVECIQEEKNSFLPPPDLYEDDPPEKTDKLTIISDDPPTDMLKEMKTILGIFNGSLDWISINTEKLNINQIKNIIFWMNSIKQESIPEINIKISNGRELRIFLEYFKKPTEDVFIYDHCNFTFSCKGNVGPLGFQCQSMTVNYNEWIQNKELFEIDFVKGRFEGPLDSQDVNQLLKNWRKGKSNSRLKQLYFEMEDGFDLDTVLNGLSPTIETDDGRVENYLQSAMKFTMGKVQINRDDGTFANIYTGESWIDIFVN